jgi:hypothetical protein
MPTSEGWWARRRAGTTEWFYVSEFSDDTPGIWVSDIQDYLSAEQFGGALIRWYGPVELPEDWEEA